MRIILTITAILLLRPAAGFAESLFVPEAPKPIHTRQNSFGVPFVMDPAEAGARRAVEVQLHVSENGGPWRPYANVAPMNGSILFRANRDGEYRFLVRTKDDHGELQPPGPPNAELTVILDTDPPVLELLVERGQGGELHARWRVRDTHLRPDSLRLEYQVGPDGPWVPVAIDMPVMGATTSAREATWMPEARSVPISIRAEVSDFAGNVTKTQRTVSGVVPKTDPAAAPANDNVAQWPGERTQSTPLNGFDPPTMAGSFPGRTGGASALAGNTRPYGAITEDIGPGVLPGAEETLPPPRGEAVLAQPSERRLPVPGQPEEIGLPPSINEARQTAPRTRRELEQVDGPRLPGPTMVPTSTEAAPRAPAAKAESGTNVAASDEKLPPGIQPRMLNTRRIELDYEVEAFDGAGSHKIEIWGTKDSGRTWAKMGTDDDDHGPAYVTVDADGLFGFRIVVVSANGVADDIPKPGDTPDVWIGVDTTKPIGRFTSMEPGSGAQNGAQVIRWDANDASLAQRPISLYYSAQPSGPWIPIGLDLPNSGEFVWQPEPNTPAAVYVRLEIRDLAGNASAIDSPSAIPLTQARPRVKIRDARPAAGDPSATAPQTWQEFRR